MNNQPGMVKRLGGNCMTAPIFQHANLIIILEFK